MSTREQKLEDAFLEGGLTVPGLTMRPFSVGTLNACKRMKLTMFIAEEKSAGEPELSPDDALDQLTAFAWLQSAPLNEVLAAVRADKWREAVELFAFSLSAETLAALSSEIQRISAQSNAAAVEVIAKPAEKDGEKDAPPNS